MRIIIIAFIILLILLVVRVGYVRQKIKKRKIRAENKELEENGLKESDIPLFGGVISFIILFFIVGGLYVNGFKASNLGMYIFNCVIPYAIYKLLNKKYNSEIIKFRQEKAEADEEKRRREIAERMLKKRIELEKEHRDKIVKEAKKANN